MIALAKDRKVPVDSDLVCDMASQDATDRALVIRGILYGIGYLAHKAGCHKEGHAAMLEIERQAKVVTRRPPEHVPAFPCAEYPMWTDPIISEAEEG